MENDINQVMIFRDVPGKDASLGQLYVNGKYICYVCEDEIRQIPFKIGKETAIWGDFIYRVTLEHSPRFGPKTPTINGVPFFKYIRMHGGNNDDHTEGCPLLATDRNKKTMSVNNCAPAVKKFKEAIDNGKPTYLAVINNLAEGV